MVTPYNFDRPWTALDDFQLALLATANVSTPTIALILGRSEAAVYARAARLGISLMPPNRWPSMPF